MFVQYDIKENQNTRVLAHLFNTYHQSIIGILDYKLVHTDEKITSTDLDKCILITISTWRNSRGAASEGIGIVVSKSFEKSLM